MDVNSSKSHFAKTHTTLEHGWNLNVTKTVLLFKASPPEIKFFSVLTSQITTSVNIDHC